MMMIIDVTRMENLNKLRDELSFVGEELELKIHLQLEEIFQAHAQNLILGASVMTIAMDEILQTIRMGQMENLNIRTVTMGISLRDCADSDFEKMNNRVFEKIMEYAKNLKSVAEETEREFGVPIINKRISITPIAEILGRATVEQTVELAKTLDRAAKQLGVDFIGGFSALVHKDYQEELKPCFRLFR
jgi:hypothetical protein